MKVEKGNCINDSVSIGVDIGGTEIKFGVISGKKIIEKKIIPTLHKDDEVQLVDYIANACKELIQKYNVSKIGVGVPGSVIDKKVIASNLPFYDTPLEDMLSERLNLNINVSNDANCAAYGELKWAGNSKDTNQVMLTIGTGIGGSIVINNEVYCGKGTAGELGHMIIERNGRVCKCGQRGCFEQYASITALVQQAEKSALENKKSTLYKLYALNENSLNGKLFFEALNNGCEVARNVFDEYTDYVALGITNVVNIFSPDAIILSGGITKEGDAFLNPIRKKLNKNVPIKISKLQNDAGIVGAALK